MKRGCMIAGSDRRPLFLRGFGGRGARCCALRFDSSDDGSRQRQIVGALRQSRGFALLSRRLCSVARVLDIGGRVHALPSPEAPR
jgi:hypothetical protein